MPAPKETIQRTSLTTNLEARYTQSPDLANVGGGSAKDAGSPKFKATDFVDNGAVGQGRESVQKEFTVNAIKGTTNFTETGLQYSTNVLKVNTNSYALGGRVAS